MPPKKPERPGNALVSGHYKQRLASYTNNKKHATSDGDLANTEKSVTQLADLELLMEEAALADREFEVERDAKLIYQEERVVKIMETAKDKPSAEEMFALSNLTMPRRPTWSAGQTTAEELDKMEKDAFLEWRRSLANLEASAEKFGMHPTPFEKNLHFWRQLWRVVERSDVVVQVVDARDPVMFRFPDLETFVKECGKEKQCVLLINKSDYLTQEARMEWSAYFARHNASHKENPLTVIFFSALRAQQELDAAAPPTVMKQEEQMLLLSREQVLSQLCDLARDVAHSITGRESDPGVIGMVGYPNVGKSSVINALLGHSIRDHLANRVSVSATPGHTKHFQTLNIGPNDTVLCDCPGLVFPSFVATKAEMICNGILPIDEIRGREFVPAIDLLVQRVSRADIERTYHITLNLPRQLEKATSQSLLDAFCEARGLHGTGHGRYDESRGARMLLKDFVAGKLLFCRPAPLSLPIDDDAMKEQDDGDDDHVDAMQDVQDADVQTMYDVGQKQAADEAITNQSRRLQRHGRKHKKARDKTPYEREDGNAKTFGARVAGKHAKAGFVRKEGFVG